MRVWTFLQAEGDHFSHLLWSVPYEGLLKTVAQECDIYFLHLNIHGLINIET
jgi:hypothetical protein